MKSFATCLSICCVISGLASYAAVAAEETKAESKACIGVFDSRLVAIAYVRSESFQQRIAKMHVHLKEAKAAGDEKRVKLLEAEGPALQNLIHKQSFSTWPIHDILQTIKEKLPEIAKQDGVDVIVSKWDVEFQREGVEPVDVTDFLVALFSPTQETRNILEGLRKKDPVPLDKF
ncbi:MAG: hypothetical protein KBH45_19590 [Verrucomicrobia bacterium]|nr:hypothetical protein [Verrucomicrobiota bacterium]